MKSFVVRRSDGSCHNLLSIISSPISDKTVNIHIMA